MKTKRRIWIAAVLFGAFMLTILPSDVSSADFDSLSASYNGTHVNVTGNIQDMDVIRFEILNAENVYYSVGFAVPDASGSFSVSIRVDLPDGRGYQLQAAAEKTGSSPTYRTIYFNVGIGPTGVTLSESSLSLIVGGSHNLVATISPPDAADKSVTWTSSDPSVAAVSGGGQVTALKAGTATITVRTNEGSFTATCSVTVSNVAATGVTIDKSSISLMVGGTSQITAAVSPSNAFDKSVTWTSSDPSVATVDGSGLVTAVKAGTTVITVTTNDGSYTRTCSVTVSVPAPDPDPGPGRYAVTLVSGSGFAMTPSDGSVSPVASGGSYSFTITVAEGYDPSTLAVRVNNAMITPVNGVYAMTGITSSKNVTAEISLYSYAVNLPAGGAYMLRPVSGSSSPVDHGGSFSFIIEVKDGGASPTVRANGNVLGHVNGTYTISNITAVQNVTAEDTGDESRSGPDIVLIAIVVIAIVVVSIVAAVLFKRKL